MSSRNFASLTICISEFGLPEVHGTEGTLGREVAAKMTKETSFNPIKNGKAFANEPFSVLQGLCQLPRLLGFTHAA